MRMIERAEHCREYGEVDIKLQIHDNRKQTTDWKYDEKLERKRKIQTLLLSANPLQSGTTTAKPLILHISQIYRLLHFGCSWFWFYVSSTNNLRP